ncbi:MAG: CinA family protein [Comamonas sp.]
MQSMSIGALNDLTPLLQSLSEQLQARGWMLATAESCTGGLIAAACTELPGSSNWFDRGFVTYSNAAKTEMLGVPPELIEQHGAVSEAVVRAMAQGALARSQAQVSVAISGVAGPGGGSEEKPVGTVWMAFALPAITVSSYCQFAGDRTTVRALSIQNILNQLHRLLDAHT